MKSFKRRAVAFVAVCITAILGIAVCGCDDLGAYENTEEYYDSFGDVIFIGGVADTGVSYSVAEYFYNKESREDFLMGEDGVYGGVEHSDYVYVVIPFNKDIEMDSLAMYMQAKADVTVYINVYVINKDQIPENWKKIEESDIPDAQSESMSEETFEDTSEETAEESTENDTDGQEYDDPDIESRIGEVTVHLGAGKWNSFTLDSFKINDNVEKSIYVEDGQYILLQIRNNSGVRVFDEDKKLYVDEQTGLVLEKAEITMTNLLVRALSLENNTEAGGE